MKLLALALAVSHLSHQLFPRAFLAASKIECQPRPRHIMRKAEPTIFTLLGAASALTTVADFIRKQFVFFQDNLGKVNFLEPGEDTEAHAKKLMDMIVQSGDASTILSKKPSVPEQVVKGTKFEQLIYTVLSDNRSTGLSALHAEPGIGKSIAAILAIQEQQASGCAGIRVLLAGDFPGNIQEFFRVPTPQLVVDVAEILFPLLKAKGIRLRIVFDNTFDRGIATHETSLMGLIRPAFEHGQHIIAITQTKKAAEELAGLNGARTRVAVQQQPEERMYRWSREQARTYLETKELEEVIDKASVLNSTEIPDDFGLWRPVDITEYVNTGMKPKAPQRAPGAKLKCSQTAYVFLEKSDVLIFVVDICGWLSTCSPSVGDLAILALVSTSVPETSSE